MDRQVSEFPREQIQWSRLRVSWSGAADGADLEAPVPVDVRSPVSREIKLPLELTPALPLFKRHFLEFRKQAKTLDDVGRGTAVIEGGPASSSSPKMLLPDALAFSRAHQILFNSRAMTATS